MITFCFLAAQGGCEPQLTAHAGGNMNLGNGEEFLIKVVSPVPAVYWLSPQLERPFLHCQGSRGQKAALGRQCPGKKEHSPAA